MNKTVLDASAFLAYVGSEPGAQKVRAAIADGAVMSAINWAEVLTKLGERGIDLEHAAADFKASGLIGGAIELVPFVPGDAEMVALLREKTKTLGLSLADRACLSLAMHLNADVWTADRSWLGLKLTIQIKSIR
ncbi:MAG TPA: type II toxin-antitoxin system VapC family toxin [Candidatus Obscuribacterales bacterium]